MFVYITYLWFLQNISFLIEAKGTFESVVLIPVTLIQVHNFDRQYLLIIERDFSGFPAAGLQTSFFIWQISR